jgi:resuscitation-promoting factor RpfB
MNKSKISAIALVALAVFAFVSNFNKDVDRASSAANSSSESCDPNYSGCVPIASDVDCAGGPGNGPEYVKGPVSVIGTDIYQLDRDGNGVGCEH